MAKVGNVFVLHQRGGDIVLRRQRVRRAQRHVGAAGLEGAHQVGGFGGHVQAGGEGHAAQRLLAGEALANAAHHRHVLVGPVDALLAEGGKLQIFHVMTFRLALELLVA